MRSLRNRLLVSCSLVIALGLAALGGIIFWSTRSTLRHEFDGNLLRRAIGLATMTEYTDEGFEFEYPETVVSALNDDEPAEVYQVWLDDGRVLGRSQPPPIDLEPGDVIANDVTAAQPHFADDHLPDGTAGRSVWLWFGPRVDDELRADPQRREEIRRVADVKALVYVARSTSRNDRFLSQLAWLLLGGGAAVLAGALALIVWTVNVGVRPVRETAECIDRIDVNSLTAQVAPAETLIELEPIVSKLNSLLRRMQQALERERGFSADVAHELRTPLAGLKSTIDVCLSRPRTPDEYREELGQCLTICDESAVMINALLEIAQLEQGNVALRTDTLSLNCIVTECWASLTELASRRQLRVALEVAAQPDQVKSDPEKLRIIIRNLLQNAASHCDTGGHIRIATSAERHAVCLRIENSGNRLSPQNVAHVFDRFWRGDASRSRTGTHFGLGLALVKRLVDRLGLRLQVAVQGDTFRVEVELPSSIAS